MMCIEDGFKTNWSESNKNFEKYSKNLAEIVLQLQQLQVLVSEKYETIVTTIQSISNCPLK